MDAITFNFHAIMSKVYKNLKSFGVSISKKKKSEWYFSLKRQALHKRERNYVERLI